MIFSRLELLYWSNVSGSSDAQSALLSGCASSIMYREDKACAAGLQPQPESSNPNLLHGTLSSSRQLTTLLVSTCNLSNNYRQQVNERRGSPGVRI